MCVGVLSTLYMYPTAFKQYVCIREIWRYIDLRTHAHTHTHASHVPPPLPSHWSRVWGVYSSTLRSNCTRAAPALRYMTTIVMNVFIPCFGVFVHVYSL